ncbi:efflux RND transporter permease subunit [Ferrimonas sp. YFM]|uniref:efflux RND transporter permease subunit n=1 Tax=Ferrimonas sp. YFM TaxID=3028878 RepID=UPI002572993E|nr:efflux RND transporter permease subunit [Ferrimonas sp. YFM]BDY05163.1 multidrug transporter AcrB [Ferrimonas sp. YFM]
MNPHNKGIIPWFATNPVAANLLLIGIIALGLLSLTQIRKEAFPPMEPNRVTISVNYDSGEAKQAEEGIAIKVEEALETLEGIKRITSTSTATGSTVVVEKVSTYDLDTLLRDIKIKVDAIYNLPAEAEKPVIDKQRREEHALWVQLYGDVDRKVLQPLTEQLRRELLARGAITNVKLSGKAEPMLAINIDEAKLKAYGLSLTDVAEKVNAESTTAFGSSLRNPQKLVRLKGVDQAYFKEEFAALPLVTGNDGTLVTLGQVATIEETYEEDPLVLSRFNGVNSLGIQLVMDERSDINRIVEQANQVVAEWQDNGRLPAGVSLMTWYDQSTIITDRLDLLIDNAMTGIFFVFIVLALFLNLRVAIWVAAGLPFVFFGTVYFLSDAWMGMTINEMTTFGFIMALGIVVDDAVVVGESIYTERRMHGDTLANTIGGTMKVAIPTLFGVLTTVAAFLALANVEGNLGQIYAQFATVVTICLLLSVVESKLILPCHLAHLDTHKRQPSGIKGIWPRIQQGADAGLQWFSDRVYAPTIRWALELRYAVVLGFIALLVLVMGLPLSGRVPVTFFPDIPGSVVTANMNMEPDAGYGVLANNLLKLEQTAREADRQLRGEADSAIESLQLVAEADDSGSLNVELADDAPYRSPQFRQLWQQLSGMPEGVRKLKFLDSFEMMDAFKLELRSPDESSLRLAGGEVRRVLKATEGVSGIDDNLYESQPQLRFRVNAQGLAMGLTSSELSRQLLQTFGGEIVQRFQLSRDEVKVRIRYPQDQRQSLDDLQNAFVRTPGGQRVPLSTVAQITSEMQVTEKTRIDGLSAAYITAAMDKEIISPDALVAQMNADLIPKLQAQYPQLKVHFAGEAEERAESTSSMSQMFLLALLAIYALLAIPLKSYVQPLLIMTAIPFGITGAILGHMFNDLAISILSLNGILALSGVVVNDSLLLVSRYNELRRQGVELKQAIQQACTGRLRAVLLTSVTTFAGLAPLLGETSMQAQFLIPAAASLGYGILFATVITLVLIPALLLIQEEIKQALLKGRQRLTGGELPRAAAAAD